MSQKRHTPEQIINKLRQAEVELARGAIRDDFTNFLGSDECLVLAQFAE